MNFEQFWTPDPPTGATDATNLGWLIPTLKTDAFPTAKIQSLLLRRRPRKEFGALRSALSSTPRGNETTADLHLTEACRTSIGQRVQRVMDYPEKYKAELLRAIQRIDLNKVRQVIQIFKSARAHGRRIFVCGSYGTDFMASKSLCEMVRRAGSNQSSRFRILALSDELPDFGHKAGDLEKDRVFVEQLKNFAEPEDVVMGICSSGNSPNVVSAIEHASWIGCRTIAVTGSDGGKLARLAELNILVPVDHLGSIGDAHMIICHIIGYYFADFEKAHEQDSESTVTPRSTK